MTTSRLSTWRNLTEKKVEMRVTRSRQRTSSSNYQSVSENESESNCESPRAEPTKSKSKFSLYVQCSRLLLQLCLNIYRCTSEVAVDGMQLLL